MEEVKWATQEICDERHKNLEMLSDHNKSTLSKHDGEIRDIQGAIVRLTILIERHHSEIEDHERRIRSIEAKPGKRWDSMVVQITSILMAATVGGFIGYNF